MGSIRTIALVGSLFFLGVACTPSQSPTPEPGVSEPGGSEPGASQAEEMAAVDSPSSSEETLPTQASAVEPGTVGLPAGSAWNTGQSDGQPGKADRGIQDYQQIILNNREKFRSCYDAARAKRDDIRGRVTLVWVLDPKGEIRDGAHVDKDASDFYDAFIEECLVGALKTLTFPASRRGMDSTVRYPFDFRPQGRPQ